MTLDRGYTPPVCPQLCKEVDAAYAEAADNVVYLTPLKCAASYASFHCASCCCHDACCTEPTKIDRPLLFQAVLRSARRNRRHEFAQRFVQAHHAHLVDDLGAFQVRGTIEPIVEICPLPQAPPARDIQPTRFAGTTTLPCRSSSSSGRFATTSSSIAASSLDRRRFSIWSLRMPLHGSSKRSRSARI